MPAQLHKRPSVWIVAALALAPAWKGAEWALRPGPKRVDAESVAAGSTLFRHEWTSNDPLAGGNGLGPVFNARSCVACHDQGGVGGGGGLDKNVTVYGIPPGTGGGARNVPAAGVVHADAVRPEDRETLSDVHPSLPASASIPLATILDGGGVGPSGIVVSQRNTPALFGDGLIDSVSDNAIVAHQREHSSPARLVGLNGAQDGMVRGRVARLVDGRIGRFGWKGEFATLTDFVKAACANEIGLSNPGKPEPTRLGAAAAPSAGVDLSDAQCDLLADFLRGLPKPVETDKGQPEVRAGETLFAKIGCADCHSPTMGGVAGLYSDLLLHDMGVELEASPGAYGVPPVPVPQFADGSRPNSAEWRTPPLWGVADSAPYLHDGRAPTLEDAIKRHGGESKNVAGAFNALPHGDQRAILTFLGTLRAPGPRPSKRTDLASK